MTRQLDRIKRRLWCRYRHNWRQGGYSLRTLLRHGVQPHNGWSRQACLSCMKNFPDAPSGQ